MLQKPRLVIVCALTCDFQQCGIFDKCRLRRAYAVSFYAKKLQSDVQLKTHRIFQRLLNVCAGWSEPLLVAHTTLLEISLFINNGRL